MTRGVNRHFHAKLAKTSYSFKAENSICTKFGDHEGVTISSSFTLFAPGITEQLLR